LALLRIIALPFKHFGVMNVIAADVPAQGDHTKMKHFTIDTDNNITVHGSKKAARETGAGVFSSEGQLAELIGPDNKRLVEIWNSLAGVTPVTKFANRKIAAERIWKALQSLGEAPTASVLQAEPLAAPAEQSCEVAAEPASEPATEQAAASAEIDTALPAEISEPVEPEKQPSESVATVDAQAPSVAPAETESDTKPTPAKKAPKAPKVAKTPKTESGPREGSKTAQVVAMLQREGGATITAIMSTMSWQKHTVRGFMAGAMKKAGYAVESFKPEGGERTYRITK
jgi:hypothetical protein